MTARDICDAYFRALVPRKDDDASTVTALLFVKLPPAPAEQWFWERVIGELSRNRLRKFFAYVWAALGAGG